MTVTWALQKAVYGRLINDATLQAIIGSPPRLYDIAPDKTAFPHIVIAEWRTEPLAGVDDGLAHHIRFRAFSRYEGRRETREMIAALYDALQDAPLALDDGALVSFRFLFSDVIRRSDGDTFVGVASFRAVTQGGGV